MTQRDGLAQLVAFVGGLPHDDYWVLAGDFNNDRRRHAHVVAPFAAALAAVIAPHPLHTFCPDEPTINDAAPYTTAWHTDEGVDHIYSNLELADARVLRTETLLSDHLPVAATLVFPGFGAADASAAAAAAARTLM